MTEVRTLNEICIKITDGSHQSPKECLGGIPMYSVKDMSEYGFVRDSVKTISEEDYQKLKKIGCEPEIGDVLIAKDGSVLKHIFRINQHEKCALLSSIAILRPNKELVDPDFLSYSLKNPIVRSEVLNNYVSGSGVPRIILKDFKKIQINVPEITVQKAIASILLSIDRKIEINQILSASIESLAKTIFKSWFIDFDPVKNNLNSTVSMLEADTQNLFSNEFTESEVGEIPKGWSVKPLDEIGSFRNGLALQKFPAQEGENNLPVVKIAQLRKGNTINDELFASGVPLEYIINDGDFIFSWSGSLLAKYWVGGKGALNQHLFKVEGKTMPLWFVAKWVEHFLPKFQEIAEDKATTMGHIKREHLRESLCVVPPNPILDIAEKIIAPMVEQVIVLQVQNKSLARLREIMLPKLISGDLQIPNAEKFLEKMGV